MSNQIIPKTSTTNRRWTFSQHALAVRAAIELTAVKIVHGKQGFRGTGTNQGQWLADYMAAINSPDNGPYHVGKLDMKLRNISWVFVNKCGFQMVPGFLPLSHIATDYQNPEQAMADAALEKLCMAAVAEYRAGMVSSTPRLIGGAA